MEPLKTGLAGMAQLSNVLRNLPPKHKWDFSTPGGKTDCGSYGCAIGVARAVWPEQIRADKCNGGLVEFFGLPADELDPIFGLGVFLFSEIPHYGKGAEQISFTDVANAIDVYIAKHQPVLPTLAFIITTPQKAVREAA